MFVPPILRFFKCSSIFLKNWLKNVKQTVAKIENSKLFEKTGISNISDIVILKCQNRIIASVELFALTCISRGSHVRIS